MIAIKKLGKYLRITGLAVGLWIAALMSFFSVVNKGVLIYYYEPMPLVVAVEIPMFVLSAIVLLYFIRKEVKGSKRNQAELIR